MEYSRKLEDRLAEALSDLGAVKKRMFGGLCYLARGNMLCGVHKDYLIVRLGPDWEKALSLPDVHPFDTTGKTLKGWVMVGPDGYAGERLEGFLAKAREFVATLPSK